VSRNASEPRPLTHPLDDEISVHGLILSQFEPVSPATVTGRPVPLPSILPSRPDSGAPWCGGGPAVWALQPLEQGVEEREMGHHEHRLRASARRPTVPMRLGLLIAALALAATACLGPAPGGLRNGYLPDSVLQIINANCKIWQPAAPSLLNMMGAARNSGVTLTPESCYRSYAGQVAERNYWCSLGLCQFAAVPGTSVHGWGKAVDFADQGGELTFSSVGYQWLTAHAGTYCFIHPAWAQPNGSAPEPWHWEWVC
jgi:hypothetical protein